jgi:hypothetical protein
MKTTFSLALFSAIVLVAASRPALAAAPKVDARSTALVAALQAVSPDALGGKIGLTVATTLANDRAPSNRAAAVKNTTDTDRQAYAAWKKSSR